MIKLEAIEKAERYLQEAKEIKANNTDNWQYENTSKQTLILGSIAASLIAIAKK
jgi:hypothetical protein